MTKYVSTGYVTLEILENNNVKLESHENNVNGRVLFEHTFTVSEFDTLRSLFGGSANAPLDVSVDDGPVDLAPHDLPVDAEAESANALPDSEPPVIEKNEEPGGEA